MTLAIISTRYGTLSADTGPGGVVHGNGSINLWLSGSIEQINAKLATLTYVGNFSAIDNITITILDAQGQITTALRTAIDVLPLTTIDPTNAVISIGHGTLTLDARRIDGPIIALSQPATGQDATTCILIDTTIGPRSAVSVRNDALIGGITPRLAIAGRVELDGASSFSGNGTAISLAQGATLLNEGAMTIAAHAAQFTGTGRLINDGTITLTGDDSPAPSVRIDPAVSGTGEIDLTAGASLTLSAAVAAAETVRLGTGHNTLHLAAPALFAGVITGFSPDDTIVLDGISAATADAGPGTLTLRNGQQIVAQLNVGAAPTATFQLGTDAAGSTTIRLATAPDRPEVYRFFDAAHGTQLLTSDRNERDAIVSTRTDLRYEGIGFQAVQPTQASQDTLVVYRFFDTGNGTHLLTVSATERDMLLGTRPDLVYEPASTLLEQATGNHPVYRFFDQHSGAHFFTASADERATILSTRPDMTAEGIAFYAPT